MQSMWSKLGVCALALVFSACTGRLSNADSEERPEPAGPGQEQTKNNTPGPVTNNGEGPVTENNQPGMVRKAQPFSCEAGQVGPELPLRRLSIEQYRRSVQAILARGLGPVEAEQAMTQLGELWSELPDDSRVGYPGDTHGGFRRLDQKLQQEHVKLTLDIAQEVAKALTLTPERLDRLMGVCATDADAANDEQCVRDFIRDFGERALRGELGADDESFYWDVYGAQGVDEAGLRDVIAVMLTSPQFLYHVEHGQDEVVGQGPDGELHRLSAYELANRLAYHFWQAPPDDALLAAARDGSLLTEAGYKAQVDRVVADARTESMLSSLFSEWLWLDELRRLDSLVGTPLFDQFAGQDSPSETLRQSMIDELVGMASYYTLANPSSFSELLGSNKVFTQDQELANLYGVQPWDGKTQPDEFAAGERAGLITRAALLSTGSANTRPIIKGFFIRKALLCVQPPPPPDNAANFRVELNDHMTTREVVEELTEQNGACAGCHQTFINALGFATENYDALGRLRQEQVLFNDAGEIVGSKAVETASVPRIFLDDMTESKGAADLSQMLISSEEVHKCFARHYTRFTFGRAEDLVADGCVMEELRQSLVAGDNLQDVLKRIALRPEFKQRQL